MPDKWEYPWFAAWDTAFHTIPMAHIDPAFAKEQIRIFVDERYMSPQGQIPAYEWAFADVNPPVNAYGAWKVFLIDKARNSGNGDLDFLESVFSGLAQNYQWWLATQSINGEMLFGGGFMGLDNISIFDRGRPLPNMAKLVQADSAAWMALFSLNMMQIALQLSQKYAHYQQNALHYARNFIKIAHSVNQYHWNDKEGVYGDFIWEVFGNIIPMPIRNIVGLSPIFAVELLEEATLAKNPVFAEGLKLLAANEENAPYIRQSKENKWLFNLVPEKRFKRIYYSLADESRYMSQYGIRSLSKEYEITAFSMLINGELHSMKYRSAESETDYFGENSNWRGPIWLPVNYVLIDSLYKMGAFYENDLKLQFPHFPIGEYMNLKQVATSISKRLVKIFESNGKERPVYKQYHTIFERPDFNENILFYEYFDGDSGRGCGASHQTGWTSLIADLIFMINQS